MMHEVIESNLDALKALCQRYRVLRLEVFGSATTEAFDPAQSDVDLLAEFDLSGDESVLARYVGFIRDAETLFGCKVDLVNPTQIRNPYFRQGVEETRRSLYAA